MTSGKTYTEIEMMMLQEEVKKNVTPHKMVVACIQKVFALVCGNCSERLQATIKISKECEAQSQTFDGIWLLNEAKSCMPGVNDKRNTSVLLQDKLIKFVLIKKVITSQYMNNITNSRTALIF